METQQPSPKISAIVCTWNNAQMLGDTLESLAKQQLPHGVGYEVIIVDNNSTDGTAEVARKFTSMDPSKFRYVVEKNQGLSFARNRGTAESRAEIVAFIDDDAIADPDWLAQLLATYEREPAAACVGGNSRLRFPPRALPSWYSERLDGFLSARQLPYGRALSPKDFPIGTNVSFRKHVLLKYGGFHPLLGARSFDGVKLQGDETTLCLRLFNDGLAIYAQPAARVEHIVTAERLTREYFLSLARGSGYLRVILDNGGRIGVSTWGQLRNYVRRLLRRRQRRWRERDNVSEPDRFYEGLEACAMRASIWYCVAGKFKLRALARSLAAKVPPLKSRPA